MSLYEETMESLQKLLNKNNIEHALSNYDNKIIQYSKDNNDKTKWYSISYSMILRRFEETRGSADIESWAERVALLSSWLPSIPTPALDSQSIEEMVYLEEFFYNAKLEEIGIESFLGDMNTIHHGEIIFDTQNRPPLLVKTFLEYADKVTNLNGRWNQTFSTTTKLLHFMCPHLFPIFDKNISDIIYGKKQTYARYHCYIFSLREFLQNSVEAELLKTISKQRNISVVRAVDLVLFNSSTLLCES